MTRPTMYAALTLLGAFALSSCVTVPEDTGCQDISGIIGREYRFSFFSTTTGVVKDENSGVNAGSTFPAISQEYRDTLVLGDHLCRAAEAGIIEPKVYEDFITSQLAALGAEAVRRGRAKPDEIAVRQASAADAITKAAPRSIARKIEAERIADGAAAASSSGEASFSKAIEIYDSVRTKVEAGLPATVRDPAGEAAYAELRAKLQQIDTAIAELLKGEDSGGTEGTEPTPEDPENTGPALNDAETLGYVLFAFNSTVLDDEARRELTAILAAGGTNALYRVEGFADATGPYTANQVLTQQRADAVADYLRAQGASGVTVRIGSGRTDRFGGSPSQNRRVVVQRLSPGQATSAQ